MKNSLEAGREALRRGAWTKARDAFAGAVKREPSAEALEGLGWALYWLDAIDDSLAARERAYRAYLERDDRSSASRVAIGLAVGSYDVLGPSVAAGWVERARNLLRRVPQSLIHGWVAFYEGHIARLTDGDTRRARTLAKTALRIAARFHDAQLELLARALEGLVLVTEGRVGEGMRRVDEATAAAMAGELHDLDSVAQTCCILLYACERVRDYKRAAEWRERIRRFCEEWEIKPLFAVCATQHAAMLIGCGEWDAAEKALGEAIERLEATRPLMLADGIVQLAELRRRQGRDDEAWALFTRVEGRTESLLGRAQIALDRGEAETAIELAERLLARPLGEKWIERAVAGATLVRASLVSNDLPRAEAALASLQEIARRVDTPPVRAIALAAAGELALHEGDADAARAALVDAVDLFTSVLAPYEAATARLALARALHALGRERAARDEEAAARAALAALGVVQPAARPAKGVLTPREREILQLIAKGLSDKQLASRLTLSEHTVHRHVANILRKLDAGSRSAAVARALRDHAL